MISTEPSEGTDLDPDLVVGSMVGEYRVEGKLGQGGFGAVFKAQHPLIGKMVAIKVLSTRFSADREMVSRFIAEAKAVNQIRHRNIIDIFSFGWLERRCYYVMEYVDGETLDARISHGALPLSEALPILKAIARALDAAHVKGIAHRDLKAENVFLGTDTDGAVFPKLLDFGIAKLMASEDGIGHKTRTGAPMGTPYYMSPEQTRGRGVDHRTDLYAFGVLVYLMLTQKYPLDGDDFMTILMRQVSDEPEPASTHVAGLPERVDQVIAWLMRKSPDERPADLMTAVRALEEVVGVAPSAAVSSPVIIPSHVTTRPPASSARMSLAPTATGGAATAVSASVPTEITPPKPRSNRLIIVAAAVIAAIVAVILVGRSGNRDGAGSASGSVVVHTSDAASLPPVPEDARVVRPEPDAAAKPSFVTITIEGAPAGTEVKIGGQVYGTTPKVQVPHGDSEVLLVLTAEGHQPFTLPIIPTANATHAAKLKPRAGQAPRAGSSVPAPGSNRGSSEPTDDIIDFPTKKEPPNQ